MANPVKKVNRMFWDIETSPNIMYSWRAGYKIQLGFENIIKERAIICICWKWEGEKRIHSLTWDDGDDREMLKAFLEEAKKADEMVAHNGDHFDMRWFRGQCAKYKLGNLPDVKTVDTCAIAKRKFYLNSYKLDYLAAIWLKERKIHTDFNLWIRVCEGDNKALREMVTYCKRDVELQERVWQRLAPFYNPKTHAGVVKGKKRWSCPRCASNRVKRDHIRVSAAGIKRYQFKCTECGQYYTVPENVNREYDNR